MHRYIEIEQRGPALWIWLNRPEVKNAFSLEMATEFLAAIKGGMKDREVAVLVISGKGDSFSAGGDIKKMSETKNLKKFFLDLSRVVHAAVLEMRRGEKPVLAAIPGYVGGVAFGMIFGCDLRIASTDSQFNAATTRLGLTANGSATWHLPRLAGPGRAAEILFLGEILSAEEALRIGLINRVVPPDRLEAETQEIAMQLAAGPRKALGRLKRLLNAGLNSPLQAQLERERQAIAWSATTADFKEGMRAFLEKRKPLRGGP